MIRALTVAVLTFAVTPAFAQEPRVSARQPGLRGPFEQGRQVRARRDREVREAKGIRGGREGRRARKAAPRSAEEFTGLSPRAVADLQKTFEKSRVEFERFQQDAQQEIERLQTTFDAEFRVKLAPIIDAVSKEKGLQFVFGLEQAAIVWWSPTVDISEEVVKRLDAGK